MKEEKQKYLEILNEETKLLSQEVEQFATINKDNQNT